MSWLRILLKLRNKNEALKNLKKGLNKAKTHNS